MSLLFVASEEGYWNRNGILKNGARLQTYLGVDDDYILYAHFISGFSESPADKDYLVEIIYTKGGSFFTVKKGEFHLGVLGDYVQGETVKVLYQGIEIFSETLNDDVSEYRRLWQ